MIREQTRLMIFPIFTAESKPSLFSVPNENNVCSRRTSKRGASNLFTSSCHPMIKSLFRYFIIYLFYFLYISRIKILQFCAFACHQPGGNGRWKNHLSRPQQLHTQSSNHLSIMEIIFQIRSCLTPTWQQYFSKKKKKLGSSNGEKSLLLSIIKILSLNFIRSFLYCQRQCHETCVLICYH